jgi:hypothetical protein
MVHYLYIFYKPFTNLMIRALELAPPAACSLRQQGTFHFCMFFFTRPGEKEHTESKSTMLPYILSLSKGRLKAAGGDGTSARIIKFVKDL